MPARRAMTFLEVVFAVAILGLVAASVTSAFAFITARQNRERQFLACAELGNRLILQYLSDDTALPSDALPIEYGHERFRWRLAKGPVDLTEPPKPEAPEAPAAAPRSPNYDRIEYVRVTVWLGEESGGSRGLDERVPSVALTRIVDPLGVLTRNPDAVDAFLKSGSRLQELMNRIVGPGGRRAPPPPPPRNGGAPR